MISQLHLTCFNEAVDGVCTHRRVPSVDNDDQKDTSVESGYFKDSKIQSGEPGYFKEYYIGMQVPLSGANDAVPPAFLLFLVVPSSDSDDQNDTAVES